MQHNLELQLTGTAQQVRAGDLDGEALVDRLFSLAQDSRSYIAEPEQIMLSADTVRKIVYVLGQHARYSPDFIVKLVKEIFAEIPPSVLKRYGNLMRMLDEER